MWMTLVRRPFRFGRYFPWKQGQDKHPFTIGSNWTWRMGKKDFTKKIKKRISEMVKLYRRNGSDTEWKTGK